MKPIWYLRSLWMMINHVRIEILLQMCEREAQASTHWNSISLMALIYLTWSRMEVYLYSHEKKRSEFEVKFHHYSTLYYPLSITLIHKIGMGPLVAVCHTAWQRRLNIEDNYRLDQNWVVKTTGLECHSTIRNMSASCQIRKVFYNWERLILVGLGAQWALTVFK